MPTKYRNAIYDQIGAASNGQHYLVDCATRESLPNIELHFGEAVVPLTFEDYSLVYYVSITLCICIKSHCTLSFTLSITFFVIIFCIFSFSFQGECQTSLSERRNSDDFLLGPMFFSKLTVIFDRDNDRVGLAEIK